MPTHVFSRRVHVHHRTSHSQLPAKVPTTTHDHGDDGGNVEINVAAGHAIAEAGIELTVYQIRVHLGGIQIQSLEGPR